MKFTRTGEPLDTRYRMVEEGLAGQNPQYLEAVIRVLGRPSFGSDQRKNELAYMSLAAMYLLPGRLDEEFIRLIAERMQYCRAIGRIKHKTKSPIYVPDREKAILQAKAQEAKKLGIPVGLTKKVFTLIMQESRRLQQLEWVALDALPGN